MVRNGIYGGGTQASEIERVVSGSDSVFYHGYVDKKDIFNRLSENDVALIPLAVSITGAVPSKIFDTVPAGLPILFIGGGEGSVIIKDHRLGLVSPSGDYDSLKNNIQSFAEMSDEEYESYSAHCLQTASSEFNFDKQMLRTYNFIRDLK